MSNDNENIDPNAPIEIKLRKKYTVTKPGNKGSSKKNNSGGCGRKALAAKRAASVSAAVCPEQYGLWAAWMRKNGYKILG
jgi:hypothetical protein